MLPSTKRNLNAANASHFLFHLVAMKLRKVIPDAASIRLRPNTSHARTKLGSCSWSLENACPEIINAPWTTLDCALVTNYDDLLLVTMHLAAHEVAHGIVFNRNIYRTPYGWKMPAGYKPHGVEWQRVMRHEMKFFGKITRFASKDVPVVLLQNDFWGKSVELFYSWIEGDKWNKDLVEVALKS